MSLSATTEVLSESSDVDRFEVEVEYIYFLSSMAMLYLNCLPTVSPPVHPINSRSWILA
jgi:hypothetical protein